MSRFKSLTQFRESNQRLLLTIRRALYWGLPPLILYLIFRRIDLEQLGRLVSNANLLLILSGIAMLVPVVVLGALRWHFLMRRYDCASLPVAASIGEYWKSLAVGLLVPGSLGSDAYRVMVLGRQKGYYLRSAFVIGVEKLAALFSCAVLIAGLYPLLAPNHLPSGVAHAIDALYVIFIAGVSFAMFAILVRRQSWVWRLAEAFNARLEAMTRRVTALAPTQPTQEESTPRTGLALMLSVFSPGVAVPMVGLSLAIYLVSAAQSQILFQAFGYEIPFTVNLFITPLLVLLYALPISFGGIGIREGAFILAYSAFGVPPETSLIISFSGFLGNLISYGIGASLFFLSKHRRHSDEVPEVMLPPEGQHTAPGLSIVNQKK
jgi:uncharacterized protein (TIRG00374 family)